VKAVVVTADDAGGRRPRAAAWVGETLAGTRCRRSGVVRADPLPRNAAGKVLKNELR